MYKYEMHLHSEMTSACASSPATDYIAAAKEKGFAGMVFTNHFFRGNSAVDKTLPWHEFVEHYKRDWETAKELGDKHDIDVIFGIEEGYGNGKECLIYGISPEIIAANSDFPRLPIEEISAFVRENGGFIACAHPFRHRGYISEPALPPNPELFDGVEVYNRVNAAEENLRAQQFAQKHNLIAISGGDVHSAGGFGLSGIALPQRVKDGKMLVNALKNSKITLIVDKAKENYGTDFEYIAVGG